MVTLRLKDALLIFTTHCTTTHSSASSETSRIRIGAVRIFMIFGDIDQLHVHFVWLPLSRYHLGVISFFFLGFDAKNV